MYTKAKGKRGVSSFQKNATLVDFSGFRELVIANSVRNVPQKLKTTDLVQDQKLAYFF